ncbi:hypothetical protein GIB67_032664 [Kingdonia uniflora]|uniref:Uncharacterized protein n=1 Tax=Kingdonia uniflora TaxID=39325 RepID=A0A7J7MW48_9MAGN|nr:hypothetical protein GIB67_032664 [Kingdonia uniflora]
MPLGTIVRLTGKELQISAIRSMDNLYKSLENLDIMYFDKDTYKAMLLRPGNSADLLCKNLKINVDDAGAITIRCEDFIHRKCAKNNSSLSASMFDKCSCGTLMNDWINTSYTDGKTFVEGRMFIVPNNLKVVPQSIEPCWVLFKDTGIKEEALLWRKLWNSLWLVYRSLVLAKSYSASALRFAPSGFPTIGIRARFGASKVARWEDLSGLRKALKGKPIPKTLVKGITAQKVDDDEEDDWEDLNSRAMSGIHLCFSKVKVKDEDKALRLIWSLPSSFKHLQPTLMYEKETLSFEEVTSTLLSEERRLKGSESFMENSTMVVSRMGSFNRFRKRTCWSRGQSGHYRSD